MRGVVSGRIYINYLRVARIGILVSCIESIRPKKFLHPGTRNADGVIGPTEN